MSAELIRLIGVTKVYGTGEAAVVALDRIDQGDCEDRAGGEREPAVPPVQACDQH